MLRERGLVGGVQYYDAQCDDARLVLATARAAIRHGALVANHVAVDELIRTDGLIRGARVRDRLDGSTAPVHAHVVVNATGPWCDRLRRLEDPAAPPLLRPTKGVHVMVRRERLGNTSAITLTSPIDGRIMFVLPWGDFSYIGTTDTDTSESPDDVRAFPSDIIYLLRSANAAFPNARLTEEDVLATWAGLRPLIAPDAFVGTSQVPREHLIVQGRGGMLTIAGGKLTTYRLMAAELVDHVTELLHQHDGRARPPRPPTDEEPLPGGEVTDLEPLRQPGIDLGLFGEVIDFVLRCHGTEGAAVFNLVRERRELGRPLTPGFPAIEAQVIHAVRRELAQQVEDVLVRRLHAWYEAPEHGAGAARRTAELMGEELGWDPPRIEAEADRYLQSVQREAGRVE